MHAFFVVTMFWPVSLFPFPIKRLFDLGFDVFNTALKLGHLIAELIEHHDHSILPFNHLSDPTRDSNHDSLPKGRPRMANYKPSDVVAVGEQSHTLIEWAAQLGTPVQTIIGRLKRLKPGQLIEAAVTMPVGSRGGQNKGQKAEKDVLATDEVEQLLRSGKKVETFLRDRSLIVLAYRSGLRCFELVALEPKDIDGDRGTITVHHGKGDQSGVVAMDPLGWAHLTEWIKQRETWGVPDGSKLFCTRAGGPLASRQVRAMFQRRTAAAGLSKRAHPHGMRRTMASEMAAEGVPLIDISGAMRHKKTSTTDNYLKLINPTSVIDAMRSRTWGNKSNNPVTSSSSALPPPGWLDRLRADVGDRLMLCHDGRANESEFKVAVVMF